MNIKSLFIISIVFLIVFGISPKVFAVTAEEVKEQINDINNQIEQLDREIAKYQNQLTETGQQKDSLNKTIQELTLTRSKLLAERNQIQKKINATNLVIKEIGNNIETKEQSIAKSEASLKKMLYSLYQKESESFVERVLSKETLEDISREYNNTIAINEDVRNYINELHYIKGQLSNSKLQKLEEQQKLNDLKKTLIAKETVVLNTKKEKDTLLTETKNKEAEYQKLLAEQIKRRDAFEKSIEDYEAQLKFILNPNSIPKEGSEVLSWPLNYILVTSPFGERWGKFHYGLDFRAAVGTPVFAMASGVVEGFGDTDLSCPKASFGKWIFIKYNNGLSSTYGHLSAISVKKGQEVKAGDIVGLSGNTGSSTGPHLHVAVYASDGVKVDTVPSKSCSGKIFTQPIAALSSYLNPALYLPKITASMVKK
ncbi:MAG TPA: peptidoglycan DD-metalloendopeptidase family protein [Candidatus Paceibacterota bacterium]|nr:peptidoglycan DD-metalloendopeptidase family protein [Candidatus Paceibacterota bacterium]